MIEDRHTVFEGNIEAIFTDEGFDVEISGDGFLDEEELDLVHAFFRLIISNRLRTTAIPIN